MLDDSRHEWVLPASIPFMDLKGKDLEECVYWLLDAMGAKDLEWRVGGTGGGAADGGRDLEALFFEVDDEGELKPQRWWVECKGRTGTVESDEVKSAVNNALAYDGLDRLIIATNTQYSNPTRDWVKAWQGKHPVPKIQLWDRTHLERYLSRHPDVVLRLFSEALSPEGRAKAMESRFWNKLEFAPLETLVGLWKARESVELTPMCLFAVVANEFANGDISDRPWGAVFEPASITEVLAIGLTNVGYLLMRSSRAGIDQRLLYRSFAYLILIVLESLPGDAVAQFVINSLNRGETDLFPEEMQDMILAPVLDQLLLEMQDLCSDGCNRVMVASGTSLTDHRSEAETYWLRFESEPAEEAADDRRLRIERFDAPCVVGFQVDRDNHCPLFQCEPTVKYLGDVLGIVKRVAAFRKEEAAVKRAEDELRRSRLRNEE